MHPTKSGWFRHDVRRSVASCRRLRMLLAKPLPMCNRASKRAERLYVHLQATISDLKVSQLSGAMTNLIYRCRYQRGSEVRPRPGIMHYICAAPSAHSMCGTDAGPCDTMFRELGLERLEGCSSETPVRN